MSNSTNVSALGPQGDSLLRVSASSHAGDDGVALVVGPRGARVTSTSDATQTHAANGGGALGTRQAGSSKAERRRTVP